MEFRLKDKAAQKKERFKAAQDRKTAAQESLEDAWRRIAASKLTDADRNKLREVHAAMQAGKIGRDPADMVTKTGRPKAFSKAEALRLWVRLNEEKRVDKIRLMVESTPDNYELIQTKEHLKEFIRAMEDEPITAWDTETTGLDVYEDVIVGISITLPNACRHAYIPVGHNTNLPQLGRDFVLSRLKDYLLDPAKKKVLHHARYDMHMFIRHGIRMRGLWWDTQVAHSLLNENEQSRRLKDLATVYLGEPSDTYSELFGKACFADIPLDVALVYAAKDTDITWRLYKFQQYHYERLGEKLQKMYREIENPMIDIVVDMEQTGFVLDTERARKLGTQLEQDIERLEMELKYIFGDINFGSPAQLSKVLFDELKLDRKLPPGWKLSTDKNTLKKLADHHDGVAKLLEYRKMTKLYGTYIDALPKQIKKRTGRVHGSFNQDMTVTGRFSSNNPNLQNQPGYVRPIFKAPPGMILLSGDFSQQEPRLLAHFSQEPLLIEAYRQGKDLYTSAAAELWGLPESECGDGSKWRKMMKMGILAVMYGTGAKTLGTQLGITQQEAQDFIDAFYRKYKYVKRWIDGNVLFARKHGYVEMLYGRKRRLPEAQAKRDYERFRAERQATNAIIQGSAAIMTKIAMIKVAALCKRKGWQLALTVHDEIGIYAPDTVTAADVQEFEECMLTAVPLDVPSKSDIEAAYSWGEGVNFNGAAGVWEVRKEIDKKVIVLGQFATPREALEQKDELLAAA